jgi:ABC-type lipoprotein export system ATPase subunit
MTDVPALQIEQLRFRYGQSATLPWTIDIAALELGAAEQMLLTGKSGSGKSTLLYLIAGLMEPNSGTIRVAGQDVHALRGEQRDLFRGSKIGMIFQTFNLLQGFTALENVLAALMFSNIPAREHRDRAMKLLETLEIERPNQRAEELSIGQQQRVAIARAVACEPALVLADEPTASLDPENAFAAMNLIQQTCRDHGAALLCTSHDPSLVDRFTNRIALEDLSVAAMEETSTMELSG